MKDSSGLRATATTTVVVPLNFAIPATEVILSELRAKSSNAVTALDLPTLRGTFEEIVGAPIEMQVENYHRHDAWQLRVSAAASAELFPVFDGVLYLYSGDAARCELMVSGTMINAGTHSSLQRFARGMAIRIAVLSRWARLA